MLTNHSGLVVALLIGLQAMCGSFHLTVCNNSSLSQLGQAVSYFCYGWTHIFDYLNLFLEELYVQWIMPRETRIESYIVSSTCIFPLQYRFLFVTDSWCWRLDAIMMKDNMQTNDAMRVQSPYYQAGTPNQMTSPYNASTGSGPSPHPIGTPGLNPSPCSNGMENCNIQRAGFMQASNVMPGHGQTSNMYVGAPNAHSVNYGTSDDVSSVNRTLTPTMHSQYSMGPAVHPSSHPMSNSGQHGRPSPSPCNTAMPGIKPGSYASAHDPRSHHLSNSATGTADMFNMTRPCSTDIASSPQTTIDPSGCGGTPGGYPPGLPPGAPSETGSSHLMQQQQQHQHHHHHQPPSQQPQQAHVQQQQLQQTQQQQQQRPNSRSQQQQHQGWGSGQTHNYMESSQLMNGMASNVSSLGGASSVQHNGSSTYAMQNQQQSHQNQSGSAGGSEHVYSNMPHHVNGTQGYYSHTGHMPASGMTMNGAPQRLPTSMANGTSPYQTSVMTQRMAPESSMMPGMTNLHHGVHHPPGPQYGAHHPGAPVPQPYCGPGHNRYMMQSQSQMKSEMPSRWADLVCLWLMTCYELSPITHPFYFLFLLFNFIFLFTFLCLIQSQFVGFTYSYKVYICVIELEWKYQCNGL